MPCVRAAALIRWIQRLRKSRFFRRRPSYAWERPFSTVFRATVHTFFLRPKFPLASFSTFLRRARLATLFLLRGIFHSVFGRERQRSAGLWGSTSWLTLPVHPVRWVLLQKIENGFLVTPVHQRHLLQIALALLVLLGKDV